jgi:deoxycytidylate deaminase
MLPRKIQRYFKYARNVLSLSDHPHQQLGCVIVKGNKVLSIGYNKLKTHPISCTPYQTIHAEMDAVIKAGRECEGAVAYVYREHKDKNRSLALARPCSACQKVLYAAGIKRVYFTVNEPVLYEVMVFE